MNSSLDLNAILQKIAEANSLEILQDIHSTYLGKKGYFANAMQKMANLSIEEKKITGAQLNQQKKILNEKLQDKQNFLQLELINNEMLKERVDLTLPVAQRYLGGIHPLSLVTEQLIAIFATLGFKLADGPEIEEDWYNFTALNVPSHHPARQEHDTFYINSLDSKGERKVLRTHTSNVQIRTMEKQKDALLRGEEIKVISIGKTYRSDSDATHSPMFHQIEGLYVAKKEKISVPLLRSTLLYFCNKFFNVKDIPLRFRPSYFPFTSPSYEVDIACSKTSEGLIIGAGQDWLEILGSGIVHPNVLENCGIDSQQYAGFAFGMGVERVTMLKYGFKDLREFFNGNIKWLEAYNFNPLKMPTMYGGLD